MSSPKTLCIDCNVEILQSTYDYNCGYCGKCYKREIRKDALKKANLNANKAIEITEKHLYDLYGKQVGKLNSDHVHFDYNERDGGRWVVSVSFGWENTDPDRFFVIIDDESEEVDIPQVL
ncbi:hypothetical protein [Acaryochloris marina]|uniref:hypothetical protein n=1 Tax=Acaryochloris marina TaxID=155978 RepID=UPI001BAF8597|nr:hypothetical protein [Acaryochloris marina]QUY44190.1 hypothetical protein I1H34_08920 [Acaryochloris marina S15]